jgi:shikimate dehydrogenase
MMKPVYTLDDLASRATLDAGADKPAKLAVLGFPVAHSASPRMHQPALDALGINARYIRLEVEPGKIAEAFEKMRALEFIGCNVTVPHKLEAMDYCTVSHHAMMLGAVNTIIFKREATEGYNTDGPGFERALLDDFETSLSQLKVAVVGAGGGAGQAIATQCVLSGARKLVMVNRTLSKMDRLRDQLEDKYLASMFSHIWKEREIVALSFDDLSLSEHCLDCDLIVNTSSVGLKPGDPSILPADCLRPEHLVYDTIYQPPVTPLLALAMQTGCRTANGLSMLIHQGALAFQRWFPGTDPLPMMRAALAQRAS